MGSTSTICATAHHETGTCVCNQGYFGPLCDQPICSSCVRGTCILPGICNCEQGWTGAACSVAVCRVSSLVCLLLLLWGIAVVCVRGCVCVCVCASFSLAPSLLSLSRLCGPDLGRRDARRRVATVITHPAIAHAWLTQTKSRCGPGCSAPCPSAALAASRAPARSRAVATAIRVGPASSATQPSAARTVALTTEGTADIGFHSLPKFEISLPPIYALSLECLVLLTSSLMFTEVELLLRLTNILAAA
jgi:hypothetical protein